MMNAGFDILVIELFEVSPRRHCADTGMKGGFYPLVWTQRDWP